MNARQKAKHYKKLYESSRIDYRTVYITENTLRHYVCETKFNDTEINTMQMYGEENIGQLIRKKCAHRIVQELEQIIPNLILMNYEDCRATFDFWTKGR